MYPPSRTLTSRTLRCLAFSTAVTLAAGTVLAADAPSWRVLRGDVRVVCPLTVGGSFEAKTSSLEGRLVERSAEPASLGGYVAVDLKSLDTGIGLRNEHLRTTYLEVTKGDGFDKAVLSDIGLGAIDWETFQGKTGFTGTFLLHGSKKTVSGHAEIRKEGSVVRVEAEFPVSLVDYGIQKPQYLGIGVKDQVDAKVSLVLTPAVEIGSAR